MDLYIEFVCVPYHPPTHVDSHIHVKHTTGQPFERPLNEKGEMVPSSDHGLWGFTRYVTGAQVMRIHIHTDGFGLQPLNPGIPTLS